MCCSHFEHVEQISGFVDAWEKLLWLDCSAAFIILNVIDVAFWKGLSFLYFDVKQENKWKYDAHIQLSDVQ